MISLRRATAQRFYYDKNGELFCYLKDGAFNGGLQENGEDVLGQNNIPVLMPPGLTVDFSKDSQIKASGFVMEYVGRNIFFVMPNTITEENGDKQLVFEGIEGTVLYHLQDNTVRITLNKNKVLVQYDKDTILVLEKGKISGTAGDSSLILENGQPAHLEAGGISLKDVLTGLVDAGKNLKTFGSPTAQQADPSTVSAYEKLQKEKIDKFTK